MGSTKIESNTTSTPSATPEEREFNALKLEQQKQWNAPQTQMGLSALNLGNQLLTSFGSPDSQMWKSLIGGVTPEQQQTMITEQERMLAPQLQAQGIYDSGLAATMRMRAATDLSNQNAQFNVGALQNAINLALSGQAQVQQPILGASQTLASQLAGLRTISQTGQQTTTNPFLQTFGQGLSGAGGFMWGLGSLKRS